MNQALDRSISYSSLLKFSLPTIISMVFMSIYSTIDGIFVARLVGTDALSAVNLVMPFVMVAIALGFMLGTGGCALVAAKLGEGKGREARENFSLILVVTFLASVAISVVGFAFFTPLLHLLGADDSLYPLCAAYARPLLYLLPFAMLGILFQLFFVAAGRPNLGMLVSVAGGVTNIVLDYVFIAVLVMGIGGAAIATGLGYALPSLLGLIYFSVNRQGSLYLVKPRLDIGAIVKAAANGASEMVSMLANSVVTIAMNNILMRLAGSDGVAAITIILYAQGLLGAVYMGYSSGIGPVISYNYGKADTGRLKQIYRCSLRIIGAISLATLAASLLFAAPLVGVFASPGSVVYTYSLEGFRIYAFAFLCMGFNVFSSSLFTALNNGRVSAILAFFRTLVFLLAALFTLPALLGIAGVWLATPLAEAMALLMTIYYCKKMKPVYKYA